VQPKLTKQQVAYAGENFVAAEIHRRGGYAVTFSGNMQGIDLLATDATIRRKIDIQVKTKTSRTWQTTTNHAKPHPGSEDDGRFWILVDLHKDGSSPDYYVMPARWMENDIHTAHEEYLAKHEGRRAKNSKSTHHSIPLARVQPWKDRWDVLGIFPGRGD